MKYALWTLTLILLFFATVLAQYFLEGFKN